VKSSISTAALIHRIVAACRAWNSEARVFNPQGIVRREKGGRGIHVLLKVLIGLFIVPPAQTRSTITLFQGLRNQYVFSLFPKDAVYILGSWNEREYARTNGYGFIPVFPVENAVKLATYRSIFWPAKLQLRRWKRWITRRDVTVVLYEDTQAMGAFLAMLEEPDTREYRAVCIQHGHFCGHTSSFRPEGRLTEYNLVWDAQQAERISKSPEKTRVIGLPYQARAETPSEGSLRVILVGLGSERHHADSICLFQNIATFLQAAFQDAEIAYRPHPNEFNDPEKIADCQRLFGQIDRTPKIELLNGPRTLFVGEVSSLLYEAQQAGHLTAFVPIDPKNIATGYHDINIAPEDLEAFVQSVNLAKAYPAPPLPSSSNTGDAVTRFASAAKALGILEDNSRHD
jgi:hypothetical protein